MTNNTHYPADAEEGKAQNGEPGCYECGRPLREGVVSDGENNHALCFDCAEPNRIVNSDELPNFDAESTEQEDRER